MPLYHYEAANVKGKTIKGKAQANSERELYSRLREKALFCYQCEVVHPVHTARTGCKRMRARQIANICRQLAVMQESGLTLVYALSVLIAHEKKRTPKSALQAVYEQIQQGYAFSAALGTQGQTFPVLMISMVAAGEASGNLDSVLKRLAELYAREAKLSQSIQKSLIYPIILCVVMLFAILILFVGVLPIFTELFAHPEDIPPFSQVVFSASLFVQTHGLVLLAGFVLLIFACNRCMTLPAARLYWDKIKLRLPVAGKLTITIYTARFARTLSHLYASGIPIVDCLQKSAAILHNRYLTQKFAVIIADVQRGEKLAKSIAQAGIFEAAFLSNLHTGEETGKLEDVLQNNAAFYEEEAEGALQKLTAILEPMLIVVMGVLVMLLLTAVYPVLYGAFSGLSA